MPRIVQGLLEECPKPMVIDADGLNALASLPREILQKRKHPTVLTPHLGEFSRLLGSSIDEITRHRDELAQAYAQETGCVLVVKGHHSLIADGTQKHINTTGNPGMATAGSGDVLTGMIASLIGQGLTAMQAATSGTYLHGLAGDLAAARLGYMSLIATDLISYISTAILKIVANQHVDSGNEETIRMTEPTPRPNITSGTTNRS